jgi:hypothetical protein
MRNRIVATLVALVSWVPAAALAHAGHTHKLLGTVTGIEHPQIQVKTTDEKNVTIVLDAASVVTRGKTRVEQTDIKVGDRISAETNEKGGKMMVKTLKLGVAPAR